MSINNSNLGQVVLTIERKMSMAHIVATALTEEIPPWGGRLPRHLVSGLPVTGVARFVLSLEGRRRGFQGRHWASLDEWVAAGYAPNPEDAVSGFLDSVKGDRIDLKPVILYPGNSVAAIGEDSGALQPDYAAADRIFDASGARMVAGTGGLGNDEVCSTGSRCPSPRT